MKHLTTILLSLFFCTSNYAAGGIWYLEVDIFTDNGQQTAFLNSDSWAKQLDQKYFDDDLLFTEFLLGKLGKEIEYYTELNENEFYVEGTPFYIDPFELNFESRQRIKRSAIEMLTLKKVWVKVDVYSHVLNQLNSEDKIWLNKKCERIFVNRPGSGCSLTAYDFGNAENNKVVVDQFYTLFGEDLSILPKENPQYHKLLKELSSRKVVINLNCGC